jgi:hypothetical protein
VKVFRVQGKTVTVEKLGENRWRLRDLTTGEVWVVVGGDPRT